MMGQRGKPHPPGVVVGAVATGLVLGPTAGGRAAGVPSETVRHWLKRYRAGELTDAALVAEVDRLVAELECEARVTMASVVARGVALIEHSLECWAEKADQLTPGQLKDLAIVIGVLQDKRQLLEGRHSSLSARLSFRRTEYITTPYADSLAAPDWDRDGDNGRYSSCP